jgi:hypothetical protein
MSYLEKIKKLSTYSHLPNFSILSKNKLYLPNSDNQYTILGKWSLDWIHSNRCAIGTVEQDDYHNITFQITSCYECTDDETKFKLVPKHIFTEFWNHVYHHDPLLSYIHINISEFYQSSPIVSPISTKPKIVCVTEVTPNMPFNRLIEVTGGSRINAINAYNSELSVAHISSGNQRDSPKYQQREKTSTPKYQPLPKEKTIDIEKTSFSVKKFTGEFHMVSTPKNQPKEEKPKEEICDKFQVCKTDKPDVYHVYQSNKYVSTCLIPNMKTSRYMQDMFEDKQTGEMITMNMKLHVNTNKYYPII